MHGRRGQPVKARRKTGARKARRAQVSVPCLEEQVAALARELKESREEQTATSEVLTAPPLSASQSRRPSSKRLALLAAAWTDPVAYVRVVASLMPREIEATVTVQLAERMTDDQLAAIAAKGLDDPLEAEGGAEILRPVD
jgi:hypothetical protein